jgi:hypothetical protein
MLARVPLGKDLDPCTGIGTVRGWLSLTIMVVAALNTIQPKSKLFQCPYGLLAIHGGGTRHLPNSDKLLQRLKPGGAERDLLTVGLHRFHVAPYHFRRIIERL